MVTNRLSSHERVKYVFSVLILFTSTISPKCYKPHDAKMHGFIRILSNYIIYLRIFTSDFFEKIY